MGDEEWEKREARARGQWPRGVANQALHAWTLSLQPSMRRVYKQGVAGMGRVGLNICMAFEHRSVHDFLIIFSARWVFVDFKPAGQPLASDLTEAEREKREMD